MTEPLYRIAPLKWEQEKDGTYRLPPGVRRLTAKAAEDIYSVRESMDLCHATVSCGGGHGSSGMEIGNFQSLVDAKAACQSHWNQTLLQYLEKVE